MSIQDVVTTQFQLRPDHKAVEITQHGQKIRLDPDYAYLLASALIATVEDMRRSSTQ